MTPTSWLRCYSLLGYFALCFGISWGGIPIILTATGFSLTALPPLETGLIFALMLLGPSVSGLILTAVLDGRAGLHQLGLGLMGWKLSVRWYAVALLTAPLFLLAILWPLSAVVAPTFAPRFQWPLFAVGLVAGSFEEVGWTGFATPRLLARQCMGMAWLMLGLVWAFWHLLVDFRYNFEAIGMVWPLEPAVVYIATLTPYRILMTWVYMNTRSVLLAVLMHASYTGWLLVLFPATSLTQSLFWQTVFAIMLWLAVALVLRRSSPGVEAHEPKPKKECHLAETDDQRRARLPAAVYDLAIRLGVKPDDNRGSVKLTQTGRMKRNLDTESWMAFTATQTISTRACEFDWRAKAGPFGMISARDVLEHDEGRLDIVALGVIPIARAEHTPTLVRGELMRYLADAWAPAAILLNTTLRWRDDGPDTLAVSPGAGETASDVMLSLDSDGRIAGGFAPDRPRSATARFLPTPWRGRFYDYRRSGDMWIPYAGEVGWEIDGKEVLYWQGRIEHWEG